MSKKRFVLGLLGLLYGVTFTVLGVACSGGGHSNLIYMLAIAPDGIGFILWPLLSMLSFDLRPSWSRRIFVVLMGIHYSGFMLYVHQNWKSEMYWLDVATEFSGIVGLFILSLVLYALGQLYLWYAFLNGRKEVSS